MSNNEYSYPPVPQGSGMGEDPQFTDSHTHPVGTTGPQAPGIEQGPRFVAFVQGLVSRQTNALEESFRHKLANREEAYNVWRQESNARETDLCAEIGRLSAQLQEAAVAAGTASQLQVLLSELPLTSTGDTSMDDSNTQATPRQDITPQIPVAESCYLQDTPGGNRPTPPRRRVAARPPIPDSAPARNLHSRTSKTQRSSTVTAAPTSSNSILPSPPSPPQVNQTRPTRKAPLPTPVQVPAIPNPEPKKSATQLY